MQVMEPIFKELQTQLQEYDTQMALELELIQKKQSMGVLINKNVTKALFQRSETIGVSSHIASNITGKGIKSIFNHSGKNCENHRFHIKDRLNELMKLENKYNDRMKNMKGAPEWA